jgi:hypothetical protein
LSRRRVALVLIIRSIPRYLLNLAVNLLQQVGKHWIS